MSKTYRPWAPRQSYLLPPSPLDWLREDHLAYFLLDILEEMDLRAIEARYESKDPRGTRPHNPRMMTALVLYAYCTGRPSSRAIERATYEDVAVRVIAGDNHPDHTRISEFRRENHEALRTLFVEVLRLCQHAGLIRLGHVALDGTKVKANASKHKAMSYEHMKKTEAELQKEVDELLARAEQVDETEDAKYGKDKRGDEVPDELRRREQRLKRIRQAKAELEAEAAAARARELGERLARAEQKEARRASAAGDSSSGAPAQGDEASPEAEADSGAGGAGAAADAAMPAESREPIRSGEEAASDAAASTDEAAQTKGSKRTEQARIKTEEARKSAEDKAETAGLPRPDTQPRDPDTFPSHQVAADKDGNPAAKAQRNFTDPDSRIMKRDGAYLQGYNAQAAVDSEHQIIVAVGLTNQAPDAEHLRPMLKEIHRNCGQFPEKLSADTGYWSEDNAQQCSADGVDGYIATQRDRHVAPKAAAPEENPAPEDAKARMRAKLQTQEGRKVYSRRKTIVEPVFGQMRGPQGLRGFLLRGVEKVRSEWSLYCTAHNLLKLFRAAAVPA